MKNICDIFCIIYYILLFSLKYAFRIIHRASSDQVFIGYRLKTENWNFLAYFYHYHSSIHTFSRSFRSFGLYLWTSIFNSNNNSTGSFRYKLGDGGHWKPFFCLGTSFMAKSIGTYLIDLKEELKRKLEQSHFFPIIFEQQLNLLTTSACFYACRCCHMIGW